MVWFLRSSVSEAPEIIKAEALRRISVYRDVLFRVFLNRDRCNINEYVSLTKKAVIDYVLENRSKLVWDIEFLKQISEIFKGWVISWTPDEQDRTGKVGYNEYYLRNLALILWELQWILSENINKGTSSINTLTSSVSSRVLEIWAIQEAIQEVPKLKSVNFRVPSSNEWKPFRRFDCDMIMSPDKWIWEFVDWPYAGEQLFCLESMLKETRRTRESVPSNPQILSMSRAINPDIKDTEWWQKDVSIREWLWLRLCWYSEVFDDEDPGFWWAYWLSTEFSAGNDYYGGNRAIYLNNDWLDLIRWWHGGSDYFSVRCLEK